MQSISNCKCSIGKDHDCSLLSKYPPGCQAPLYRTDPLSGGLGEVDSCLDSAIRLAAQGRLAPWESVQVVAQRQGRGQLRRLWYSPPGNLYAALRLPAGSAVQRLRRQRCLRAAAGARPVGAGLGNDAEMAPTTLSCRTAGRFSNWRGLLLEERGDCLLAGIGINILFYPGEADLRRDAAMPATCLARLIPEKNTVPTAESLWRRLVKHLLSAYTKERFFAAHWREEAERLLLWRHCNVIVDDGREETRGRLEGLAPDGGLRLVCDGREKILHGGSLRPDLAR